MLKRRLAAFSLLEMALVLSIMGVISAYAIQALLQARAATGWRETDTKLESAIYALAGFVQVHQRLPSPADPASKDNPGGEDRSRTIGILPYRTLGIQESDAQDGFRHWISYSASQDLTADAQNAPRKPVTAHRGLPGSNSQDSSNPICHVRPHSSRLDVRNAQGQSMLATGFFDDLIAFVLVSHGPSGAGSFDDAGQRRPATGDKLQNLGVTPFLDRAITQEYDDRVRWVSRNNLMAMYAKQPCKPLT